MAKPATSLVGIWYPNTEIHQNKIDWHKYVLQVHNIIRLIIHSLRVQ